MNGSAVSRLQRAGFTLIEMLVAVTILAIMTIAIARITSQTNDSIASNTRQAVENSNARSALDLIAADFAQSIADGRVHFRWNRDASTTYSPPSGPIKSDDIGFFTYRNVMAPTCCPPPPPREVMCVSYGVRADPNPTVPPGLSVFCLFRKDKTIPVGSYTNRYPFVEVPVDNQGEELIRNVVEFRTDCRNANGAVFTENANVAGLPVYVDVYLSVLTDRDVQRLSALSGPDQATYINRNVKRYHTRLSSLNRNAYVNGR